MSNRNQHVIPYQNGWAVKSVGSRGGGVLVYATKREAIDAAQYMARLNGGNLIVHGTAGQIFHSPAVQSRLREGAVRAGIRRISEEKEVGSSTKKSFDSDNIVKLGLAAPRVRTVTRRKRLDFDKVRHSHLVMLTINDFVDDDEATDRRAVARKKKATAKAAGKKTAARGVKTAASKKSAKKQGTKKSSAKKAAGKKSAKKSARK